MIEGLNTEAKRRWPKLALGAAALVSTVSVMMGDLLLSAPLAVSVTV